jgi:BA14K-like protein
MIPGNSMIDNRILGAMAIAMAGILFGFTTGRLSAWLVPPTGMASVGSTAKPSVPLKSAAAAKQPTSTPRDGAAAPDQAAKPTPADAAGTSAEPTQVEASVAAKPTPGNVTSRALSPGEPQGGTGWADADTKLINPGSIPSSDRQQERVTTSAPSVRFSEGPRDELRTRASYEGMERCRQKYRSFDPSDGTYKPYGQDTRVPCPHLGR